MNRTLSAVVFSLLVMVSGCTLVVAPSTTPPTSPAPSPERERTPPVSQPEREAGVRSGVSGYRAIPVPDQLRALWVVRTTLTDPDSIVAMVDRAAAAGFNTILVQVRGRGDAYYQSRWEPKPATVLEQGPTFDPLALVIREAHARGLGVHAWVNAYLVGGTGTLPTDPTHLIRTRPHLLAVPREMAREFYGLDPGAPRFAEGLLRYAQDNLDRIEGIYAAPSHPEVKEHLYSVWMDLPRTMSSTDSTSTTSAIRTRISTTPGGLWTGSESG